MMIEPRMTNIVVTRRSGASIIRKYILCRSKKIADILRLYQALSLMKV